MLFVESGNPRIQILEGRGQTSFSGLALLVELASHWGNLIENIAVVLDLFEMFSETLLDCG